MIQLLEEMFENLSNAYYKEASEILDALPDSLQSNCILTKIEFQTEQNSSQKNYDHLKVSYNELLILFNLYNINWHSFIFQSLYYTFILVQSETMFIVANAYNGKVQNEFFQIPKLKLLNGMKILIKILTLYHSKLTKLMQTYEICQVEPIRKVFRYISIYNLYNFIIYYFIYTFSYLHRGSPNSKWQDTYIHLDLTSLRIQLAYKEITSILECIDSQSEKDENNSKFVETITQKMNEAYKQIENAKNFAEFSCLLIAKAQRNQEANAEKDDDNENLFPSSNNIKTIMSTDEDLEIEDEVFEEYIREEYLKPLYENENGSVIESFKLDKLLKKNFMSELKEALIEKQKSMTERELRALKRMYEKVCKDTYLNKPELGKVIYLSSLVCIFFSIGFLLIKIPILILKKSFFNLNFII